MPNKLTARASGVRPLWLIAGASLWMATVGNAALWNELWSQGIFAGLAGWSFGAAFLLIITALLTAFGSLFAWRWTLKPVLTVLLMVSAAATHFMLSYHIVIDRGMLVNVLQTDAQEARALLDWHLLAPLAVIGLLPATILWRVPVRRAPWQLQIVRNLITALGSLVVVAALALLSFQTLSSTMRGDKTLRYLVNPLNTLYAVGRVAQHRTALQGAAPKSLGSDAAITRADGHAPMIVLVLGETGRSGNFSLNGYGRATTPELERLDVASARQATSCGTSTAESVPCMFSHLGRARFGARPNDYENLLDVIEHAGMAVLWIDNQSGCKGVCDRVPHFSTSKLQHPILCRDGECVDEIMLEGLDDRLKALPAERVSRGVVLVLHQMGSHGPEYHLRSPPAFKRFVPECASARLQDCRQSEVVNAYDNTIAYTDHFLASTIKWLQRQEGAFDTAMVYVSDHGESLGENNLYLHGMPFSIAPDVQTRVPWITWLSQGIQKRTGVGMECLRARRNLPLSHDNYFHSVLGLLQVSTREYDRQLDMYAACASH